MVSFDPYLNWLGIPPHEQPPNFYRLLGVILFESNPQVIEQAADRQSLQIGAYQSGPQGEFCQQLLSEIAMARFCLLDPLQKAAYDGQLQEGLAQRGERAVAAPPPAAPVGPRYLGPSAQRFGPPAQQFGPPATAIRSTGAAIRSTGAAIRSPVAPVCSAGRHGARLSWHWHAPTDDHAWSTTAAPTANARVCRNAGTGRDIDADGPAAAGDANAGDDVGARGVRAGNAAAFRPGRACRWPRRLRRQSPRRMSHLGPLVLLPRPSCRRRLLSGRSTSWKA